MRWHPPGPAVPSQAPAQLAPPPPGTEVAADLLEKSDGTRWLRVSASRASSVLTFRRVCDEAPIALWIGQPPRVVQGAELLLAVPPAAPPAPGEPTCLPARQRLFVFAVSRPPMLEGILLHCKSNEELLAELRAQRGPDVGAVELEEPPRP